MPQYFYLRVLRGHKFVNWNGNARLMSAKRAIESFYLQRNFSIFWSFSLQYGRNAGLHRSWSVYADWLRFCLRLVVAGRDHVRNAHWIPAILQWKSAGNLSQGKQSSRQCKGHANFAACLHILCKFLMQIVCSFYCGSFPVKSMEYSNELGNRWWTGGRRSCFRRKCPFRRRRARRLCVSVAKRTAEPDPSADWTTSRTTTRDSSEASTGSTSASDQPPFPSAFVPSMTRPISTNSLMSISKYVSLFPHLFSQTKWKLLILMDLFYLLVYFYFFFCINLWSLFLQVCPNCGWGNRILIHFPLYSCFVSFEYFLHPEKSSFSSIWRLPYDYQRSGTFVRVIWGHVFVTS